MIRLAKYTKPYLWWILLAVVLLFAQVNCDLALPDYLSRMVNIGIQQGAGTSYILQTGGSMLVLTLLSVLCTVAVVVISSRVASGIACDMRGDVFDKVSSFSNAEFDRFSTASLITRSTNDITQVQLVGMMMIRIVFYAPLMGIGGILRMLNKDVSMFWLIAGAVVFSIGFVIVVILIATPKFRKIQNLIDRLNLVSRENLAGMLVIRAFNRQPFEEKRFDVVNQDLSKVNLFVNRVTMSMMPVMMLTMNALGVLIVWVGARQVAAMSMQVGDIMAAVQYATQIVMAFLMLSTIIVILPRASVSANRIAEVLETETAIHAPRDARYFSEPFQGIIEFDHVSFRYPNADEDALHDINFMALPGQTTALIGTTGAGKSTLANLILRYYDVNSGAIRINGTDIRLVTQHDLRARIGYVPQKSILFSGSVESNLRFADDNAGEDDIHTAIEIAQAAEFVLDKPEGIAQKVVQGGGNFSGGQKQRLAIARALVRKPPIYIFDDSFSALDLKTDAALRQALQHETRGSTLIIVSQRIATIQHAEQIIVLDEGKVVGKGTHAELMQSNGIYRELAQSQLSMEALV
jgi:ATP-binding cassette subfamily B multidrug efflux pump